MVVHPDEPHAYLAGDILETMGSSDNAVRGGLTPKFKDIDIFVKVSLLHFFIPIDDPI